MAAVQVKERAAFSAIVSVTSTITTINDDVIFAMSIGTIKRVSFYSLLENFSIITTPLII